MYMHAVFKTMLGGLLLLFTLVHAVHGQVVISQVYGGGGNSGATLRSDFIELHNNGAAAVDLSAWSVQYTSSTGTSWSRTNLSGSIAAGGYFLVKQADGAGGTVNLPTPDTIGTIAMAGTAGKIALVNTQTLLTGACPLGVTVIDFVGYGTAANCSETAPTAAPSNTTALLRAADGCTDSGNNNSDFTVVSPAPRNSASPIVACAGTVLTLSINDVAVTEGNSGTINAAFTVSLSAPAPAGGVTFDIATADNTATVADNDYVANTLTGQTIAAGDSSATFTVAVNGDTTVEANESFFVNVSNVLSAIVTDGQANGTINSDDIIITPIHSIQGAADASPLAGSAINTRGIVTGVRNTGFFLQTADSEADADPATSQGVFVFTSTTPAVVRGDQVLVAGNVVEFFGLTEIANPVITVLSSGNVMPAAITLTTADGALPSPERYESMRVIPNLNVVAPAGGNENEANATSTSTGNFYGVLPGVARPFREPGVSVLDAFVPAAGVTRFDGNLELIVVQSRGLGGAAMNPNAGDVLSNISGILDYGFGFYKFYPDNGQSFTSTVTPTAVSDAAADEFSVAGFNLFRFFDTVNEPVTDDPVLTTVALNNRLAKTADAICGYLKTPDVIGVVEVENIDVLRQLADTINNGQVVGGAAVPSCSKAPQYVPYLVEGNDIGGIDVGFLVSTKIVGSGSTPRVEVLQVVQENDDEQLANPDGTSSTLNDRPTLRLQAVIHDAKGAAYPVTIMINHLRSLSGVNGTAAGSNGWPSDGARIRAKRLKQAESLARLIDARQIANPNERIILLGDFNAFEFSDGFVDSMGIITGKEVPASQVTLHSGFVVGTPLTTLTTVDAAAQRYSFSFEGNAQSLDHAVVNEPLLMQDGVRSEHARINADFAVINYGVYGGLPTRVSDHDPVIVYIKPRAFQSVDLAVAVSNPDTVINNGANTLFTVTVSNLDTAIAVNNARLNVVLDTPLSGVTVAAANGWVCTAPVVTASNTTISCTALNFAALAQASFGVTVNVPLDFAGGNISLGATISADQGDSLSANNIASDTVNGNGLRANLAISAQGPSILYFGRKARIQIAAENSGPNAANNVVIAITTSAPANVFKMRPAAGWNCELDTSVSNARYLCNTSDGSAMANAARAEFDLTFKPTASMISTRLIIGVGIASDIADPVGANNENSYSLFIERLRRISPPAVPGD
jgi:uncharacterized protein